MMGSVRITNRLRAIQEREVRWISEQALTQGSRIKVGRIIGRGPYAKWLPRKDGA